MPAGLIKLRNDLDILEAMTAELESYLRSSVLFWPMDSATMPRLTLGGFWLRYHRLQALRSLLSAPEQQRVAAASAQYAQIAAENVVRIERKAHTEVDARLRLWRTYLNDVRQNYEAHIPSYPTAVEARAILQAQMAALREPPYALARIVVQRVRQIDSILKARWQTGEFVWPDAWQPAYPQEAYWWLYGRPKRPPKSDDW